MVKSDALVPSLSIVDNDVRVSLGVKARERLLSVSCGGMTMGLLKFFISNVPWALLTRLAWCMTIEKLK